MENEVVQDMFRDKVVLVTGAGGSIGSEVSSQLMKFGLKRLLLLDIDETELHNLCLRLLDYRMEWSEEVYPIVCDIKNGAKLAMVMAEYGPDVVIHTAAYKHVPLMELYPEEAVLNNVCGSYNVFKASKDCGVGKVVVASTDKAVNPTSIMGATKRMVEMMACSMTDETTRFCCVRFGNVIGSRGSMLPLFLEELEKGKPITVTDKDATRYFMTIPNAVELLLRAAVLAKGGEVMVLGMGEPVKIYDFAQNLANEYSESNGCPKAQIAITGLRPGEKLHEELFSNADDAISIDDGRIFVARMPSNPKYTDQYLSHEISSLGSLSPNELVAWLKTHVPEFEAAVAMSRV